LRHAGELADNPAGWKQYLGYLDWLQEDDAARKDLQFDRMSKDWAIGGRDFKLEKLKQHKELTAVMRIKDVDPRGLSESLWEERIDAYLKVVKKTRRDIADDAKGAAWKVAVAAAMKQNSTAGNPWLARRLNMGSPFRLCRQVGAGRKDATIFNGFDRQIAKCKV
jgi:hypothetical protein